MSETRMVKVSDIVIDEQIQSRVEINQAVVQEYAEAFKANFQFPPVVVFFDKLQKMKYLADGFHRYEASVMLNIESIPCEIWEGTRRDAILFSVGANAKHGLRRTNEDKRKAVETLLNDEEWSKWSDRKIAKQCGVSHEFVRQFRPQVSTVDTSTKRKGADGKEYPTKQNIGKNPFADESDPFKNSEKKAKLQAQLFNVKRRILELEENGNQHEADKLKEVEEDLIREIRALDPAREEIPELEYPETEKVVDAFDGTEVEASADEPEEEPEDYEDDPKVVRFTKKDRVEFYDYWKAVEPLLRQVRYSLKAIKSSHGTPIALSFFKDYIREVEEVVASWEPGKMEDCPKCGGTGKIEYSPGKTISCENCFGGKVGKTGVGVA